MGGSAHLDLGVPAGAPFPVWKMVVTIVKCFVGSGVLFLPKAFSNGGWLFSSLSFIACAALTNVCVMKLIACRGVMPPGSDYGAMGARVAGRWGVLAVNAALVLSQAGFCCVYISFVARNLIQLFNDSSAGCWVGPSSLWLFIAAEFLVLAPLTWVRRLTSFAPTNLAANLLILAGIVGVLAYSVQGMAAAPPGAARALSAMAPKWPVMLGTAIYAFEGAGMVVPMVNELPPGDRARFPRIFALTLAGVSALYLAFGLVPYAYLRGYSDSAACVAGSADCVQDTITLNLPHVWWSYALTGGYCLALVFSYPFMLFPAVRALEDAAAPYLLFAAGAGGGGGGAGDSGGAGGAEDSDSDSEALLPPGVDAEAAAEAVLQADSGWRMWRRNAFRSLIVGVTLLVAYVGAPQLDNMVALIGAFCCTPIAFIFPAWFHAALVSGPAGSRVGVAVDYAIVLLGLVILVFSTTISIQTWSTSTFNACIEG